MSSRPISVPRRRLGGVLLLAACAPLAAADELNPYEWLAVAPLVVVAKSAGNDGRVTEFVVEQILRGDPQTQSVVRVRVRRANRERGENSGLRPLQPEPGSRYVLLLQPEAGRGGDARPAYTLVRGVRGAREVPAEGARPLLEALERFVSIQTVNDDAHAWREFRDMLGSTNPILLHTALEQFLKFSRATPEHLPSVRPLLDHPDAAVRQRAARLIGQVLERHGSDAVAEPGALQGELVARARRDPVVEVRVAATEALDELGGNGVARALEEIADLDPDQHVRYVAEKLIHDREQRGAGGRDGGSGR